MNKSIGQQAAFACVLYLCAKGSITMKKALFIVLLAAACPLWLGAQCDLATDEVDPFDSTRLVTTQPISIGLLIPSLYETVEGAKIIDEAKAAFSFVESDRDNINAFFLTIAIPEYEYRKIASGHNVILAFSDSTAVSLLNFPDKGVFDPTTNMRLYQHTCVVPIDLLYRMSAFGIAGIRIRYEGSKRTVLLSAKQQQQLMEAMRCAGEAVGFFPIKP